MRTAMAEVGVFSTSPGTPSGSILQLGQHLLLNLGLTAGSSIQPVSPGIPGALAVPTLELQVQIILLALHW